MMARGVQQVADNFEQATAASFAVRPFLYRVETSDITVCGRLSRSNACVPGTGCG